MGTQAKKTNALLAAVNRAVPKEDVAPEPPVAVEVHAPRTAEPMSSTRNTRSQRPSRTGTKLVAGHFEPKVARQLRIIAAEEDTTIQALLEEALDLLFIKKGRAHIKDIRNN